MICPECGARASFRKGDLRRFNSIRQVGRHQEKEHKNPVTMDNVRYYMSAVRSKGYKDAQREGRHAVDKFLKSRGLEGL